MLGAPFRGVRGIDGDDRDLGFGGSEHPNIEIQVMPTEHGPHAAHHGTFNLYEMPEPYPDVAHVETVGGLLFIEEPTVSHIREVRKDLVESALPPEESIALVKRYLEGTSRSPAPSRGSPVKSWPVFVGRSAAAAPATAASASRPGRSPTGPGASPSGTPTTPKAP
jgi:hypothetical protein